MSDKLIPFSPVPLARTRHDGWSPERQRRFIDLLSQIGLVSVCARAVGMSAKSAYALRKRPGAEGFAAAWDEAVGCERFTPEAAAIDRALGGERRSIFYRGKHIVYNDKLLIAVLRARHPNIQAAASRGGEARRAHPAHVTLHDLCYLCAACASER